MGISSYKRVYVIIIMNLYHKAQWNLNSVSRNTCQKGGTSTSRFVLSSLPFNCENIDTSTIYGRDSVAKYLDFYGESDWFKHQEKVCLFHFTFLGMLGFTLRVALVYGVCLFFFSFSFFGRFSDHALNFIRFLKIHQTKKF